jgi:hypothetical protein
MGAKQWWWEVAVHREQRGRRCCSVKSGRTVEGSAIVVGGGWRVSESGRRLAGPQRVVEYTCKQARRVSWLEQWLKSIKGLA